MTPELHEAAYLIRKGGYFYRPNAQGYTTVKAEAGRYTLAEAISYSHPNGANGPRDGIDYMLDDEPAAPKCPACDGTKVVSQGGHDTGCNACYVSPQTLPAPGEVPEGMKPWTGGDAAPVDWDNGPVVLRNGSTMFPSNVSLAYHANGTNRWNHQRENRNPAWDIIAYTPTLATVAAANDEGVARKWASNDDPVGTLAIRLAATANEAEEEHGEWTWREIADAAIRLLSQGGGK